MERDTWQLKFGDGSSRSVTAALLSVTGFTLPCREEVNMKIYTNRVESGKKISAMSKLPTCIIQCSSDISKLCISYTSILHIHDVNTHIYACTPVQVHSYISLCYSFAQVSLYEVLLHKQSLVNDYCLKHSVS